MGQPVLDKTTYKKIKGMTREEMQNFLTNYYNNVNRTKRSYITTQKRI